MNSKALQLASRFALPPNSLGYCGKGSAPAKFISCVLENKCAEIDNELEKFIVLNPYLETISKLSGLNKFSYKVVEAYWLGNDVLNKAKKGDYLNLLKHFSNQGVPEWLISELKEKVPENFIPLHLFQVLYIGVGKASGSVPYNLETINNCMVRWGNVKKIKDGKLYLLLNSLKRSGKKIALTCKNITFPYRDDFLPGLKVGVTVAVHWKQVVKVLNKKEGENLEFWTKKVLTSLYGSFN